MSREGDVVIVTGASRGIGRAVARRLVREGRRVAAVARDASRLEALVDELGGACVPFAVDLASSAETAVASGPRAGTRSGLVAQIVERVGLPTGLVAAAGIAEYATGLEVTAEAMRRHFELHVLATLELGTALATRWIAAGVPGSVVAISSTLATRPAPYTLAYGTSKAALDGMIRGLALELAGHGIRFNTVAPGVVDTEMVRAPRPDGSDPEERLRALAAHHPVGRLATPDEIATTILHVLDAPFMTGSTVVVDGGLSLG